MASNSKQTERIRANKVKGSGKGRKSAIRKAQRIQSEARLEAALGEKIPLKSVCD